MTRSIAIVARKKREISAGVVTAAATLRKIVQRNIGNIWRIEQLVWRKKRLAALLKAKISCLRPALFRRGVGRSSEEEKRGKSSSGWLNISAHQKATSRRKAAWKSRLATIMLTTMTIAGWRNAASPDSCVSV